MGMDLANFTSQRLQLGNGECFERMHPTLKRNYRGYESLTVPMEPFMNALGRDKKNTGANDITVILPDHDGRVSRVRRIVDPTFIAICAEYFHGVRLV